jgi:hypothetical protein
MEWYVYSHVPFDLRPFDLKIRRGHLIFTMYQCTITLMSIKQRFLKILSNQYFPMSSFILSLSSFDFKIDSGHLLFNIYRCKKFDVRLANGSKDIDR